MESKVSDSNLQSVLASLQKLSQTDRQRIIETLQSKPSSLLSKPGDGYNDWLNELRLRGLAEGTINLYSRTIRKLLEIEPIPTNRTVRAYLAERLKVVTPTKVRNDQKALKSFFGFLEEQGLWLDNPVKTMRLMKVAKKIRQAPPAEDVDKLVKAWQGSTQRVRDRLIIALLVATGARVSEVCSIKRDNINLEKQTVKIFGKGRKERVIPIPPVVIERLHEYITQENPQGEFLFPANNQLGYQGIRNLEKTVRRLCKRLGIKPITPHGLRHFYATSMLKNGARIEIVSRLLGHTSVAITDQTYVHIGQEEAEQEGRRYSPLADRES